MKGYLSSFFIFILLLAGIIYFYVEDCTDKERSLTWLAYIYFSVLTFVFHYGIERTTKSRPQVFIRFFMAATTLKLSIPKLMLPHVPLLKALKMLFVHSLVIVLHNVDDGHNIG